MTDAVEQWLLLLKARNAKHAETQQHVRRNNLLSLFFQEDMKQMPITRMTIKQQVHYECFGPDGKLKWMHDTPQNTLTELMDVMVADAIAAGPDPLITHAHLGTGIGQGAADTNLSAHFNEARTVVDSTTQGAGGSDNDVVIVTTFPAGICTGAVEEAGLFSNVAQATADMKAYDDTISKVKAAADSLVLTWTLTFGAS